MHTAFLQKTTRRYCVLAQVSRPVPEGYFFLLFIILKDHAAETYRRTFIY
jgi:hypothetical protein